MVAFHRDVVILEKDNKLYYCLDYPRHRLQCDDVLNNVNVKNGTYKYRYATFSEYKELLELKKIRDCNPFWIEDGVVMWGTVQQSSISDTHAFLMIGERNNYEDNAMKFDEWSKTLEVEVSTECVKYRKVDEILRRYNVNCSKYNFRLIGFYEYTELFDKGNFQTGDYWIDGGIISNGRYYTTDTPYFKNDMLWGADYRKLLMVRTVKKEKSVLDCFLYPEEEYPISIGNVRLTLSDAIILSKKIQDNINNYNEYLTGKNKKIYDIENKIKELCNELEQLKK